MFVGAFVIYVMCFGNVICCVARVVGDGVLVLALVNSRPRGA